MKAAVLENNEHIVVKDIKLQPLSDDKVRVKIFSCGICGSDIPRYFNNSAHFYPLILGHEFYGRVIEIGKNVFDFNVGDDVVGIPLIPCFKCEDCSKGNFSLCKNYKFIGSSLNGAYCEVMDILPTNIYKISKSIANIYCTLFEPSAVALHAIKFYTEYRNKNVAVIGGGTIGTLIAKWASIYGAKTVTLFERNLDGLETYKRLGIDSVFMSNEEGFRQALDYNNISNHGFDFVFDAAGVQNTIIFSLLIAANKANVCFVGTPTKNISFEVKQWEIINRKELTIKASWMCYSNPFPGDEWKETNDKLLSGELSFNKLYFAGLFNLDDVEEAFNFIKEGKNGKIGRVCLIMNGGE